MQGNPEIVATLNSLLADELTAINQSMVHSEMCSNWGYGKLHEAIKKRALTEVHHAEKLIARIIFLEGQPQVSKLKDIHIGANVEAQLKHDLAAEQGAVAVNNAGVKQAAAADDNATRELLESILKDEEDHLDWIEAQFDQISQMGIQNYLAQQM